jgi:phage shock protein PspC (stress-responsive transcriptional regulator)
MRVPEHFYRDKQRGVIGGVCAGLAHYFAVRPIWVRLIFILLALAGGTAVPAYMVLWILLPEREDIHVRRARAVRRNIDDVRSEARRWGRDLQDILQPGSGVGREEARRAAMVGGALIVLGLLFLASNLDLMGVFRLDQLWPLALILIGAIMANRALRSA